MQRRSFFKTIGGLFGALVLGRTVSDKLDSPNHNNLAGLMGGPGNDYLPLSSAIEEFKESSSYMYTAPVVKEHKEHIIYLNTVEGHGSISPPKRLIYAAPILDTKAIGEDNA